MAVEVTIPRLGWAMEKGSFVEWRKAGGEAVREGEVLFVFEGDKAEQEVEALASGTLAIPTEGPKKGDELPVGAVIGWLLAPGEAAPSSLPARPVVPSPTTAVPPAAMPAAAASARAPAASFSQPALQSPAARSVRRVAVSPRARRLAAELGVDVWSLVGSGSSGRVAERDVRAAGSRATGAASRSTITARADLSRLDAVSAGKPTARPSLLARVLSAALGETVDLFDPAAAPAPTGARIAVMDLARHGIDGYVPGLRMSWPLMIGVGTSGSTVVSLSFSTETSFAEAIELLARARAALEQPWALLVR
jgi:pyruvate/2-oxoglutarate dehydrogenase complex dihydrolipoamide acyltransferase (E2) component